MFTMPFKTLPDLGTIVLCGEQRAISGVNARGFVWTRS